MPVTIKYIFNYTLPIRVFLHLSFWMALFAMQYLTYIRIDGENAWILFLKDVIALLSIFYSTSYIIIPKLLMKGKFFLCLVWMIVTYIWWAELSYLAALLTLEWLEPNERLRFYIAMAKEAGFMGPFRLSTITFYLLDFIFLVSLPLGMKVMQSFVIMRNQKTTLELDNIKLELSFLKSQINPHFLFNTLNNIYILVSEQDPRGAESMVRLSGIMYYLLHVSERQEVLLEEEYTFLENYMELEKLRFSDRVNIETRLTADSAYYTIVPLIIFPFVENAFKHGPKTTSKDAWVTIHVAASNGVLTMEVSNGFKPIQKPDSYVGGIGIENVRKRLELHYAGRYKLSVKEEGESYVVRLILDLLSPEDGEAGRQIKWEDL